MPKSPLMELRELNVSRQREKAEEDTPTPEAPTPSQSITQSNAQVSNDLSKQVSKYSIEDLPEQAREELGEEVSMPLSGGEAAEQAPSIPGRKPAARRNSRAAGTTPAAGYAGVKDRLQIGAGKEPLVRLSVDVSETLHTRLKQYCAAHRIPSGRLLIVTLLEDFLDNEGS